MKLVVDENNITSFYNSRYDGTYMEKHTDFELYRVQDTLNKIPISPKTILDYGCGQGGWVELLSSVFPGAKLFGIDISDTAIDKANKRFTQSKFYSFDGETAPFEDGYFDLIFSYHVIEHVYNLEKTIADISRLLNKNGYLCLILPCGNDNSFEERVTRLIKEGKEKSLDGRIRFFYEDIGHIRRLKSAEIIKLFAEKEVRIYEEYYAHHLFGSFELICQSDTDFVKHLFDINQSINLAAKLKLMLARLIFIPLTLNRSNLKQMIKMNRGLKKVQYTLYYPFKIISILFLKLIKLIAFVEWKFYKKYNNGSEMYLILQKI